MASEVRARVRAEELAFSFDAELFAFGEPVCAAAASASTLHDARGSGGVWLVDGALARGGRAARSGDKCTGGCTGRGVRATPRLRARRVGEDRPADALAAPGDEPTSGVDTPEAGTSRSIVSIGAFAGEPLRCASARRPGW